MAISLRLATSSFVMGRLTDGAMVILLPVPPHAAPGSLLKKGSDPL
jgi:hypothetical protein